MTDLVQEFLREMELELRRDSLSPLREQATPSAPGATEAPTDREYLEAWRASVMPDFEPGCEEGCC